MAFTFPETMPTDAEALTTLREEAIAAFNEIYGDGDDVSAEAFEQLEYISAGVKEIDTLLEEIGASETRAEEAAAMAADFANKDDEGEPEEEEEGDNNDDEAVEDDAADTETKDGETDTDNDGSGKEFSKRKKRTDFSAAARRNKADDIPKPTNGFRLTTSAQNFESGIVNSRRVAEEFGNLAKGRAARVVGANGRSETTVAYIDRDMPDNFTVGDESEAVEVLDRVTDESRLQGGSLTAAGGWVSPSETMYDFLPTIAAGDLLSLPELSVRRGGVKFPKEPDFSAIYDAIGFHQTEEQAIAGQEKPVFEVGDAEFEEVRLDVQGIFITAGILQDKAWPELTAKYVNEALRAHQHKISAHRIGSVVEGSDNVGTLTGPQFGAVGAVLNAVELQVHDMRVKHRLPSNQTLEGIAPVWLLAVLRADLSYRQGVLPQQVSDAQLKAHFAERGANLQFVVDWQTEVIGGEDIATRWPETVDLVLYPSGTWWSAVEPVVNLGIIHDSTMLKQNKQIQMFTEDGVAVGKRGSESRLLTIPVDPNGTVGPRYSEAAGIPAE